jgi:mannose-6-phosphate isomerase-like protein (cupin superfamily)
VTVHRGQVIEDDTLRLEFTVTAAETAGQLHEMWARYAPESPYPPAHHHPGQRERFIIEEGQLLFDVDGDERLVGPGEEIVIPAGAVHRVRNPGADPAVAVWQTRPALRTGEFLLEVTAAMREGGVLRLAAVVDEYGDVYRLATRPRRVSSGAVRTLAGLSRTAQRIRGSGHQRA